MYNTSEIEKRTAREWEELDTWNVIIPNGWCDVGFGFSDEMFEIAWNSMLLTKKEYEKRREQSEISPKENNEIHLG